jgi:hypothetical protein
MAKGQDLSKYQKGIVNRYYQHLDTLTAQKLGELVSELYLCTDEKKAAKLWKSADQALAKTSADPAAVAKVIAARDAPGLARLVAKATAPVAPKT